MKNEYKLRALALRKHGLSYGEIQKKIKVSKSTLSIWLREVELTPEQINNISNKMNRVRYEVAKRKVARRIKITKDVVDKAKREVKTLSANPLFFVGLALYWAEGTKGAEKLEFTNSDKDMIKLMMQWFREICRVHEEKFRIHMHMHDLHIRKNILSHWSRITNIPLEQFYKPHVKHASLGQRKNILYSGTCAIKIHDKNLFRKIVGWRVGMQELFAAQAKRDVPIVKRI